MTQENLEAFVLMTAEKSVLRTIKYRIDRSAEKKIKKTSQVSSCELINDFKFVVKTLFTNIFCKFD